MSFEPPDDSYEEDEPLNYDDQLDGVSTGGSGGPTAPAIFGLLGIVVTLGLFLGPTLFRLAFGNTLGEPCNSGGDCRSGRCLQPSTGGGIMGMPSGSGEGICSDECYSQSECPSELRCFQGDCAPKPTAELGDSCTAPWDCRTGKCMVPRKNNDPLGGPTVPGLETYADSGTCKSQEEIEQMRENIRRLKETQEKLRNLQRQFDR